MVHSIVTNDALLKVDFTPRGAEGCPKEKKSPSQNKSTKKELIYKT